MIKIFNEDCIQTMQKSLDENSIDLVITSPRIIIVEHLIQNIV